MSQRIDAYLKAENETPTRRRQAFVLADEARRVDQLISRTGARARHPSDEDATVNVGPEENRRLLASMFTAEPARSWQDDEPTLDAPAPAALAAPEAPAPTNAPAAVLAPEAMLALGGSALLGAEAVPPISTIRLATPAAPLPISPSAVIPHRESRPSAQAAPKVPSVSTDSQTLVVAGIWAMALSLLAVLLFMAS